MENNAFVVNKSGTSRNARDCNYRSYKPHSMAVFPRDIAVYVYNAGESIHHALLLLSQLPFAHYPLRICTPL
jgi:hypothetical protein